MESSIFTELDSFLKINDHESMDWCDGGESEIAERYLGEFEETDWVLLNETWVNRSTQWQGCLVSILGPSYGQIAQEIILQMAYSQDSEIAFEAMYVISFYCGINANSEGEFIDDYIVHTEFKNYLNSDSLFLEAVPKIGKLVGRKYELLQQVLRGQP